MKILKYTCQCILVGRINSFVCQSRSYWGLSIFGGGSEAVFPQTAQYYARDWFVGHIRLFTGLNNFPLSNGCPEIRAGHYAWLDQNAICNQSKSINAVLAWLRIFQGFQVLGCGQAGLRGELEGVSGALSALDNSVGKMGAFYRKFLIFLTELRSIVFFQFRGYCRFYGAGNSSLCAHAILKLSVQEKYRDLE